MKLVKFDKNWADEFDVYGFAILTEDQTDAHMKSITEIGEWYFGTNEGWGEFDDGIFSEDYTVVPISEEEAEYLISQFGKTYGHFPTTLDLK